MNREFYLSYKKKYYKKAAIFFFMATVRCIYTLILVFM